MNRLWVRLSLTFSVVVFLWVATIALNAVVISHPLARKYFINGYLREDGGLLDELALYYQEHGSWDGANGLIEGARAMSPKSRPGERIVFTLVDAGENVVHSTNTGFWPPVERDREEEPGEDDRTGPPPPLTAGEQFVEWTETMPIQVDGEAVGYLRVELVSGAKPDTSARFVLERLRNDLLTLAIIGGMLGILFGVLVSRSLTAPLGRLADAARAIGAGDFSRRVKVGGTDEIIEVSHAFNDMADGLEQAEILRRNLVADVAHELRTPLSVLQGNLRAILDDVYPLDKAEVARLYDETRLLSRLVNDLRELSQAEAGQLRLNLKPVALAELIGSIAAVFGPNAEEKGISLVVQIPEDLPPVEADSARLAQVLYNLVANALRHTQSGGMVTVRARRDGKPSVLRLEVQDTGEGISAEHLPHVFDRFYRADNSRSRMSGGAGLGLAIVRAIVEMHGGEVTAESDGLPGHGSTFIVKLPFIT